MAALSLIACFASLCRKDTVPSPFPFLFLTPLPILLHQERLSGVRTIEKTIGELGAMFSKLAGLVSIQAEQIERIDTQVTFHHQTVFQF
jgi:hypothetical protein